MPQCNAPTQTSASCRREVATFGDRCWDYAVFDGGRLEIKSYDALMVTAKAR